ncbi:MAG TPA: hypothetical protein VNF68_06655 [Candidatus Baltobacteraceae bacterium]|nr:hypothetical protein [Candidatus Baltobacteraceae bacterium]
MKTALPIIAAGGTFAGAALAGLLGGIVLAGRSGNQLWVLGGLFAGLALGGYSAVRMLLRTL